VGQLSELENLFEPFEGQFDLPTEAVKLQDLAGLYLLAGQGGKQQDVVSREAGAFGSLLFFLRRAPENLLFGFLPHRGRQLQSHHSPCQRLSMGILQPHRPVSNLPGLQRQGLVQSMNPPAVFIHQGRMGPAHPHQHMALGLENGSHPSRTEKVPIGQDQVARCHRSALQQFPAMGIGQLVPVTSQRLQVESVVEPPPGSLAAGALQGRAVDNPGS